MMAPLIIAETIKTEIRARTILLLKNLFIKFVILSRGSKKKSPAGLSSRALFREEN